MKMPLDFKLVGRVGTGAYAARLSAHEMSPAATLSTYSTGLYDGFGHYHVRGLARLQQEVVVLLVQMVGNVVQVFGSEHHVVT